MTFYAEHCSQKYDRVNNLEDWNIVIDLCTMLLCYTLGNPHNVATFLFFEL